ncbi:MAG: hypothetical protein N839_0016335 [Desulfofustis sp. PB-SRB1]|jgi:hypothetical protein|nr:hypothetical protein [Desulfofustis sp. PB-SRB1]MBM1003963.1 hypothetical protein [Desulfofustis sp. PB-SRB1]
MHSLPSVTIDAGVLAVPHVDCAKDDAFHYVDTLLDWSKLLGEPWVAIYMSERASEALIDDDLFPLRHHLRELFDRHGVVEYSPNDIATVVENLLSLTPSFETYYRVKDVLSENLETDPDVIRLTTYDGLQSDLARCITLIAVLRKHCSQPLGGHSLILREAPKQVIQVRAHIHELEHTRDDIPVLPCPPEFFEGDVLVCDDFRSLIDCLDESAILVGASDDLGVELAIRIALFKNAIAQGGSPDWSGVVVPAIGSRFRELCQQVCADQGDSVPPKILRSIIETIKGHNLPAVHALRTGPGGNDPQRMRGSDKAQRRDIDREFHLHYWECADGTVELASVVYHYDFSIPE